MARSQEVSIKASTPLVDRLAGVAGYACTESSLEDSRLPGRRTTARGLCSTPLQLAFAAALACTRIAAAQRADELLAEGGRLLRAKSYEQALANFLAAYAKDPNPRTLLEVAATLRDMGRIADAANSYQRYLLDPASGSARTGEITELLARLDEQLTLLTVRVASPGSDVSIDAGPFIAVRSALVTRVHPGIHLVRIRNAAAIDEVSVNGFEGESKEIGAASTASTASPQHQDGWLITGHYASDGTGNTRDVLESIGGARIVAIAPVVAVRRGSETVRAPQRMAIASGALGVLRVDSEGRGFAGGLGLAISRGRYEGDVMVLRSNVTGGYIGLRYRFLAGFVRPYAAIGVPGFVFDNPISNSGATETKLALGARAAGGVEFQLNRHLGIHADIGFEHFWSVGDTRFVANVWVPSLGVIARL